MTKYIRKSGTLAATNVFHTHRDCYGVDSSDELETVTDEETERFRIRKCHRCKQLEEQ